MSQNNVIIVALVLLLLPVYILVISGVAQIGKMQAIRIYFKMRGETKDGEKE